jgi:hypothetical protein
MPNTGYLKLFVIITFSSILLTPNLISSSYSSFGSEKPHWQIVYINDNDRCLPNDLQNIQKYSFLVESYFELYRFETFNYEPNCISLEQLSSFRAPYYLDLLILFFDENLVHHTLGNKGLSGLYAHTGNDRNSNHFILLNERSSYESDHDSKNPSWVLSNSLSHFILYYKGYDESIIEKSIQPDDPFYRNCFGKGVASSNCLEVKELVRPSQAGQDFIVIPPFEGAVGNSLIQYLEEEISESSVSKNLHKQITKWWISGKLSDDDYIDTIKLVARIPSYSIEVLSNPPLEIQGGFALPVFSFEKELEYKENSSYRQEIENQLGKIDNFIPFERQNLVATPQNGQFPDWFKERASLWVDGEVSDFIFLDGLEGLLRSKNVIP